MRRAQLGLSLIEMMVAVLIGMIGIIIITQAYLTSENFNRSTLGEGSAQTNGLIALYALERDTRMSGYGVNSGAALACGNLYWYYSPAVSANAGGALQNVRLAPLVITVDSVSTSTPDQVTVLYSTKGNRILPTSITTFSKSPIEAAIDGTDGYDVNDFVVLAGANGCTLARVTGVVTASQKLQFDAADAHNPANWTATYPGTLNYVNGDSVLNLGAAVLRTFSIANGKLRMSDSLLQTGAVTQVDVVDLVVDLRAMYGKDDGFGGATAGDGDVDHYDNVAPATSADWQRVLAVKIGVLVRSGNYEKPSSGGVCDATVTQPTWSQGSFLAVDIATTTSQDRCYRYRVFETTIPLRNMIWRPT